MSKKKITLTLDQTDGAILFKKNSEAPDESDDFVIPEGDDLWAQNVRQTIAFFAYATQRDDWVQEFEENVMFKFFESAGFDEEVAKEKAKENAKERKYKHLTVIK